MFPAHHLATRVALALMLWLTLGAAVPAQTETMRVHFINIGAGHLAVHSQHIGGRAMM
jgi:hypothetical protein